MGWSTESDLQQTTGALYISGMNGVENELKVLIELTSRQLSDNEIHTLEKGSFQDLASLERL